VKPRMKTDNDSNNIIFLTTFLNMVNSPIFEKKIGK